MHLSQILNLSLGDQTKIENACNEDDLQWKTTSKYLDWNISASTYLIILKLKLKLRGPNNILQISQMKTNSNGRQPQNIKSGISQQPLIE